MPGPAWAAWPGWTRPGAGGSSMKQVWREFGNALWNDPSTGLFDDLYRWDRDEVGLASQTQPQTVALSGAGQAFTSVIGAGPNKTQIEPRSVLATRAQRCQRGERAVNNAFPRHRSHSSNGGIEDRRSVAGARGLVDSPVCATVRLPRPSCGADGGRGSYRRQSRPHPQASVSDFLLAAPVTLSTSNVACWRWVGSTRGYREPGLRRGHSGDRASLRDSQSCLGDRRARSSAGHDQRHAGADVWRLHDHLDCRPGQCRRKRQRACLQPRSGSFAPAPHREVTTFTGTSTLNTTSRTVCRRQAARRSRRPPSPGTGTRPKAWAPRRSRRTAAQLSCNAQSRRARRP